MKVDSAIQLPNLILNQNTDRSVDKAEKFARLLDQAAQPDDKLYQACQELESVFVSQVLNSMRAAIPRSDLLTRSFADDVYESMLYDEYAKGISKTDSLGLAEILYRQLKSK
jgi:flagellar protein FlgJ